MQYRLKGISTIKFNLIHNKLPNGQYDVTPIFKKNINKIDDENFDVKLMFALRKDEDKKTPFDLELIIVGEYELKSYSEEELNVFLNVNAIQILFPYLRSMLSSAMASLMINPIIIPVMDARNILAEEENL